MTIACRVCEAKIHGVSKHLAEQHPEMTLQDYKAKYPGAPLYSDEAKALILKREQQKAKMTQAHDKTPITLAEAFRLPAKAPGITRISDNQPVVVERMQPPSDLLGYVPEFDSSYIFPIDTLKLVIAGFAANLPVYLHGHAGSGKTSLIDQACAGLHRPVLRVQHTVNTEESHVLGQYVVKNGETVWQEGPLAMCMRRGMIYLADEYDRGMPQVLSLYQPVLEGKPLIIKEAPPEFAIVHPHPDFRFAATGNTNGSGDETGLYPSTALQDFANYDRFGLMERVHWMGQEQEAHAIEAQSEITFGEAKALVDFATKVRDQFEEGKIGAPISTRALVNAGKVLIMIGDIKRALHLSYINKLPPQDRQACSEVAQRIFGSGK